MRPKRSLGIVGEVRATGALLPRAWDQALRIAALPPQAMNYSRIALTKRLRAR